MLGRAPIVDFDGTLARLGVDWDGLRARLGITSLDELWTTEAGAGGGGELEGEAWRAVTEAEVAAARQAQPVDLMVSALARCEGFAVLTGNSQAAVDAFLDRRPELGLVVHLRDADGRAEPRGLDEHRIVERALDVVALPDRVMARDRNAAVPHHLLEEVLVHRERRARDAGADVRDARELEQPLHRPVLAERAVQDRQHDVDGSERGERAGLGGNGQRLRRTRLGV